MKTRMWDLQDLLFEHGAGGSVSKMEVSHDPQRSAKVSRVRHFRTRINLKMTLRCRDDC